MSEEAPKGEMLLRTLAMPADTNANGDIFGGWIMSQMDIAGGILAKQVSQGRTVTVAVDTIKFIRPVSVGDVVCCYGVVQKIGRTSMTLHLEVWVRRLIQQDDEKGLHFKVTEANFTYVAIDENRQKREIPK